MDNGSEKISEIELKIAGLERTMQDVIDKITVMEEQRRLDSDHIRRATLERKRPEEVSYVPGG